MSIFHPWSLPSLIMEGFNGLNPLGSQLLRIFDSGRFLHGFRSWSARARHVDNVSVGDSHSVYFLSAAALQSGQYGAGSSPGVYLLNSERFFHNLFPGIGPHLLGFERFCIRVRGLVPTCWDPGGVFWGSMSGRLFEHFVPLGYCEPQNFLLMWLRFVCVSYHHLIILIWLDRCDDFFTSFRVS